MIGALGNTKCVQSRFNLLQFLSQVPVTWDETIALDGKLGEFVVIARKNGNDWYIGGMTDWSERSVEIDLSGFTSGKYAAEMLTDGINANKIASDYQYVKKDVTSSEKISVTMKKGGGFAIHLKKL